jgi:trehalose-phosphatase
MPQTTVCKLAPSLVPVESLFLDYDGTISPLGVSREKAIVPNEIRQLLGTMGKRITIAIVTSKDSSFVVPRTPFAHAWSAVCGLETLVGGKILEKPVSRTKHERIDAALKYVQLGLDNGIFAIEKKRNSRGEIVAFCVDWCSSKDPELAKRAAEDYVSYFKKLSLHVAGSFEQFFFDVYPYFVEKGNAVRTLARTLGLKHRSIFLGDSEMDNSAFQVCDVSVGVIHDSTKSENLDCDYFVDFKSVASFFEELLANNLIFDPKFSTIRPNRRSERT